MIEAPKNVLFIDDDKATNFFNKKIARNYGKFSTIVAVQSGSEGLNYIKNCLDSKNGKPDLIFLDINMPAMNGWEFLKEFKKLEQNLTQGIEIVILSTSTEPKDINEFKKCKKLLDFINKPIDISILNEVFQKLLATQTAL